MMVLIRQLLEGAQNQSLFERYCGTRRDGSGSPKRSVPATEAYRLGDYWTEPVEVPLQELSEVKAKAVSKGRSRDVQRAKGNQTNLPPIEVIAWRSGLAELFDGNHRLVEARRSKDDSISVRFTFPDA